MLLQRNDGSLESVQNISSKREICSKSVNFQVRAAGTYYSTIFNEVDSGGILNSSVYFAKEFMVNGFDDNMVTSLMFSIPINIDVTTDKTTGNCRCSLVNICMD